MNTLKKVLVSVIAVCTLCGCVNESGTLKSQVQTMTDKDGKIISETQTLFDKNGNILEIKSKEGIATFTYEGNRCIESKMDTSVMYYEYDGDILIKSEAFENNELVQTVIHSYEDDNRIQTTTVDKNGIVLNDMKMAYDSNNVLLSITGKLANDETREIANRIDVHGNIAETLNYANGKLVQTEQNEYSKNVLTKKIIMIEGIKAPTTIDYVYDDKGKLIEERVTRNDGATIESIITYKYTY